MRGEEDLRNIFSAHYNEVFGFVFRRVSDGVDAEDVVAEVFRIAWQKLDRELPSSEMRDWLLRVAALTLRNQERSARRRQRLLERLFRLAQHEVSSQSDPGGNAVLLHAFGHLRPKDREVLTLIAWDGLTHAEAADLLGLKRNTFEARLSRAKASLRRLVADYESADRVRRDRMGGVVKGRGRLRTCKDGPSGR